MTEDENEEENSKEEDSTEDDIDERQELEENVSYREKLEKWFVELEERYGSEYSNQMRQRYISSKQFELFYDMTEANRALTERQLRFLEQCQARDEDLAKRFMKLIQKEEQRTTSLEMKLNRFIEDSEKREKEFFEQREHREQEHYQRLKRSVEDSDARELAQDAQNKRIADKIEELADLKKKKLLETD